MTKYSFSESVRLGYSLILTKLFFPKARLVRRPFFCHGREHLAYGEGFTTGYSCRFDLGTKKPAIGKLLTLGNNCKMGDNVHIVASEKVVIGDNCLMASKIFISDTSHGSYTGDIQDAPLSIPDERELATDPVIIGDNVWIGENVCIMPGVTIGHGCIIGANAVVTSPMPDHSIIAGIPARVIKRWDAESKKWIAK